MTVFNLLSLFGGLALFLYGMDIMGAGLEKLGGSKFERILAQLTSNPVKGVLLGIIVTAVIQSSSATTVMVVGFVNSGIMQLSQAIGIIMGANIGTTVTSWILSLGGIDGDSFFIQMLKPINFTPILAMIGIISIMFAKSDKKKTVGNILLGFSVLMFGMDNMSESVKPLADVPQFTQILVMFENPLLGVLAGAVLTAVIQSSSASVGILQALSATGAITFGAAIPIILGQNIGTCATALISCIGANKNARRAAVVHLYFNVIGTVLFLILFYLANAIFRFEFVGGAVNAFSIAIVHTIFNFLSTSVLLPFNKVLERLARATVKEGSSDVGELLDARFLNTPSFAIQQCVVVSKKLAEEAKETFVMALEAIENYSEDLDAAIIDKEQITDDYEDELTNYMIRLSSKELSVADSRRITMLMHSVSEFEQMGDYAVNILHVAREKYKRQFEFSPKAKDELAVMKNAVLDMFDRAISVFSTDNIDLAEDCEPLADMISFMRKELKNRHINRMQNGTCTVSLGFVFTDYLVALDKVADHCQSVAASVIQMKNPGYELHGNEHEKRRREDKYKNLYSEYSRRYALPFSNTVFEQ